MEIKLKACEERVFLAIFSGSFLYLLFLTHSKAQACTRKSYDYIQSWTFQGTTQTYVLFLSV